MASKSPSPVLDSFVKCLRNEMERTAKTRDTKHIKVPKAETMKFRDDILDHLKGNFGIMDAGKMLDLIADNFSVFMKRQGRIKRMGITAGIKGLGVDPTTERGRKWWLSGMGCVDEGEPVILNNKVAFEPSGEFFLYFKNFKDCLDEQMTGMIGAKKKKRTKKGRKSKRSKNKGKKGKKGKKTRRR